MDKETRMQQLQEDFFEFAAEYPQTALSMLAGNLVGLLEYTVEEQGCDPSQEIKIDGEGKRRDITISANTPAMQPPKNGDGD